MTEDELIELVAELAPKHEPTPGERQFNALGFARELLARAASDKYARP